MNEKKTAIIIGAGPAGLTAAYELLENTDITPIVFEQDSQVGGISRTVVYKGNRMDIGGHRFFSKSDRVMNWWQNILPVKTDSKESLPLTYQHQSRNFSPTQAGTDPDKVFLVRKRTSRIYYQRQFYDYPISLTWSLIKNLGLGKSMKIALTYLKVKIKPRKPEESLEDFFINHFGTELYNTFFKTYSTKLWGSDPKDISADWGKQRVRGVSVSKTITTAIKQRFSPPQDLSQKETETSLIQQFLYPMYGPGQLWEEVARRIEQRGGKVLRNHQVEKLELRHNKATKAIVKDKEGGETKEYSADHFFSSMPIPKLISGLTPAPPKKVKSIAEGLQFRDFITIGVLLDRLTLQPETDLIPDNWIYIHDPKASFLRIQIFNNWSPALVNDPNKVWIGLEYITDENSQLWSLPNEELVKEALKELEQIGFADSSTVLDHHVVRMKKTYPVYLGTYEQFDLIKKYTDTIENLFLIGRNGMHRYNNQDHSMLTAMTAVGNIAAGRKDKNNIWNVNTEEEYHETR